MNGIIIIILSDNNYYEEVMRDWIHSGHFNRLRGGDVLGDHVCTENVMINVSITHTEKWIEMVGVAMSYSCS